MRRPHRLELMSYGSAATLVLLATVFARAELTRSNGFPTAASEVSRAELPWPNPDSLDELASLTIRNNPFRISHQPSATAFGANSAPPQPSTRPSLSLLGLIADGNRAIAVVGGLPGRAGEVLLTEGDTIAGLRLIGFGKDAITIKGADSTWTIRLKRGWEW
jgi:hypothetical protein